ncbi:MAG: sugar ABC transporter permease [Syntrophomonas sp.]
MTGCLFLFPSLAGVLIFFLLPFLGGFYYAVVDNPVDGRFVGLMNFIHLLGNQAFQKAAANSALFTFICVPLNMGISLFLALLIKRAGKASRAFQRFFIFPLVIPVASVAFFWQIVFEPNGILNNLISSYDLTPIDWMKTGWSMVVIIIVYLWKYAGYNVVLFLSALSNIPAEYYESAEIDGANSLQQFFHITLVYLTPAIFFVFIISIINSLKVFRETYLIAGKYPHDSIYMLQHYMNNMFISLDYQKLTSVSYLTAAFVTILVFVFFTYQKKITSSFS